MYSNLILCYGSGMLVTYYASVDDDQNWRIYSVFSAPPSGPQYGQVRNYSLVFF